MLKTSETYFRGPLTKHQSTVMVCPKISELFKQSSAAWASLNVSNSTRA